MYALKPIDFGLAPFFFDIAARKWEFFFGRAIALYAPIFVALKIALITLVLTWLVADAVSEINPDAHARFFDDITLELVRNVCVAVPLLTVCLACSFATVTLASRSFSTERADDVLPLLLMTRISPMRLVLLKTVVPALLGISLAFATLPVAIWGVTLNGMSWRLAGIWMLWGVCSSAILAAAGTCIAAWSRDDGTTFALGWVATALFWVGWLQVGAPWRLILESPLELASVGMIPTWRLPQLLVLTAVLVPLFILAAPTGLSMNARHANAGNKPFGLRLRVYRRVDETATPIVTLMMGGVHRTISTRDMSLIAGLIFSVIASAIPVIGVPIAAGFSAVLAAFPLSRLRNDGALTDLATLPQSDTELGKETVAAIVRFGALYLVGIPIGVAASPFVAPQMDLAPVFAVYAAAFTVPIALPIYLLAVALNTRAYATPVKENPSLGIGTYLVVGAVVTLNLLGIPLLLMSDVNPSDVIDTAIAWLTNLRWTHLIVPWFLTQAVTWGAAFYLVPRTYTRTGQTLRKPGNSILTPTTPPWASKTP